MYSRRLERRYWYLSTRDKAINWKWAYKIKKNKLGNKRIYKNQSHVLWILPEMYDRVHGDIWTCCSSEVAEGVRCRRFSEKPAMETNGYRFNIPQMLS